MGGGIKLKWSTHSSNLLSLFQSFLNNESLVDVTLAAEGQFIKAHRILLSASSLFFQELLCELGKECHPVIFLKGVKFTLLQTLVQFIYKGEIEIGEEDLQPLLSIAQELKIRGITDQDPPPPTEEQEEFHPVDADIIIGPHPSTSSASSSLSPLTTSAASYHQQISSSSTAARTAIVSLVNMANHQPPDRDNSLSLQAPFLLPTPSAPPSKKVRKRRANNILRSPRVRVIQLQPHQPPPTSLLTATQQPLYAGHEEQEESAHHRQGLANYVEEIEILEETEVKLELNAPLPTVEVSDYGGWTSNGRMEGDVMNSVPSTSTATAPQQQQQQANKRYGGGGAKLKKKPAATQKLKIAKVKKSSVGGGGGSGGGRKGKISNNTYSHYSLPEKRNAVKLLEMGYSCRQVAGLVGPGCSSGTPVRWKKQFEKRRAFLLLHQQQEEEGEAQPSSSAPPQPPPIVPLL